MGFMRQALEMGIVTHTTTYPLRNANETLADLRAGRFDGAAVHIPWRPLSIGLLDASPGES